NATVEKLLEETNPNSFKGSLAQAFSEVDVELLSAQQRTDILNTLFDAGISQGEISETEAAEITEMLTKITSNATDTAIEFGNDYSMPAPLITGSKEHYQDLLLGTENRDMLQTFIHETKDSTIHSRDQSLIQLTDKLLENGVIPERILESGVGDLINVFVSAASRSDGEPVSDALYEAYTHTLSEVVGHDSDNAFKEVVKYAYDKLNDRPTAARISTSQERADEQYNSFMDSDLDTLNSDERVALLESLFIAKQDGEISWDEVRIIGYQKQAYDRGAENFSLHGKPQLERDFNAENKEDFQALLKPTDVRAELKQELKDMPSWQFSERDQRIFSLIKSLDIFTEKELNGGVADQIDEFVTAALSSEGEDVSDQLYKTLTDSIAQTAGDKSAFNSLTKDILDGVNDRWISKGMLENTLQSRGVENLNPEQRINVLESLFIAAKDPDISINESKIISTQIDYYLTGDWSGRGGKLFHRDFNPDAKEDFQLILEDSTARDDLGKMIDRIDQRYVNKYDQSMLKITESLLERDIFTYKELHNGTGDLISLYTSAASGSRTTRVNENLYLALGKDIANTVGQSGNDRAFNFTVKALLEDFKNNYGSYPLEGTFSRLNSNDLTTLSADERTALLESLFIAVSDSEITRHESAVIRRQFQDYQSND
ncbi:MAG: hypothetical protein MI864_23325, partial [Pseudomonadales bacterium]|nr:hypothetical protein [Pseudomonadales bacterium]